LNKPPESGVPIAIFSLNFYHFLFIFLCQAPEKQHKESIGARFRI
jgi:hypothetical protein